MGDGLRAVTYHRTAVGRPRVVIVGAGPHGLTAAMYLIEAGMRAGDLTIVDPSGEWMATWRSCFTQLGIAHLRSPAVGTRAQGPPVPAVGRDPSSCRRGVAGARHEADGCRRSSAVALVCRPRCRHDRRHSGDRRDTHAGRSCPGARAARPAPTRPDRRHRSVSGSQPPTAATGPMILGWSSGSNRCGTTGWATAVRRLR
jgi:hypothetical protein